MLSEPGTTFESACEALGLEVNSPDNYITKDSVIPKIGVAEAFSDTVFKLSKGDVSDPVKIGLGYCIIKVADKKLPNEEMFEKEKELFTKKIIFKKKLSHLKEWEEDLIEKADLQRNTERHQGD